MYALVENNIVAQYPYSATDLIRSKPDVSWPVGVLPDDLLSQFGVLPVRRISPPIYDPATQHLTEGQPEQKDNTWVQTWIITDKTPEEIASEINQWRSSTSVTPLQIRRALRTVGLLDDITSFVEAAPVEVREAWEYAIQIDRTNEMIVNAALTLGMSEEEVDDLFRLALTL